MNKLLISILVLLIIPMSLQGGWLLLLMKVVTVLSILIGVIAFLYCLLVNDINKTIHKPRR